MTDYDVCLERVRVHTPARSDAGAVEAFFGGLSFDSLYQRFFTGYYSVPSDILSEFVTETPSRHNLIACVGDEVVGHAMWCVDASHALEFGVVVTEKYRRRGIATRLIRNLLEAAVLDGATTLRMHMLCGNRAIVNLARTMLPGIRVEWDGDVITGFMELDLSVAMLFGCRPRSGESRTLRSADRSTGTASTGMQSPAR